MKNFIKLIFIIVFITSCSMNKVINKHGVRNLNQKQAQLTINESNKNDIKLILGPPSTKSVFDNDIWIFIERETISQKIIKLGKEKLITNNVLVLEINSSGILQNKKFYNKEDMQKVTFDETATTVNYSKKSFVYKFLSSVRQKIDDPLGKKRIKD